MTLEERMDSLEARVGKDDEMIRALRDAVTATAHMEAANSRAIKEHAYWLVKQDEAIARSREEHDRRITEHDLAMRELDRRIADLVGGSGEFIRRTNPS